MSKQDFKVKCVTLKGELEDWGKHILMPPGVTLCGLPTVDADMKLFPILKEKTFADMFSEYEEEEWDITCERCLEMIDILEKHKESKKHLN